MPIVLTRGGSVQQLRNATITFDYDAISWDYLKSASYEFDFSELVWKREMKNIFHLKEAGEIPEDIAERLFERIWFVNGLPETVYWTESERKVPATKEERDFLKSGTKRLTQYRAQVFDKCFRWLPDVDTADPYGRLTAAFTEFLASLDI